MQLVAIKNKLATLKIDTKKTLQLLVSLLQYTINHLVKLNVYYKLCHPGWRVLHYMKNSNQQVALGPRM